MGIWPGKHPCADGLELVRIESTGAKLVYKPVYVLCGILILVLLSSQSFRAAHLYMREPAGAASGWFAVSRSEHSGDSV